jgi:hypothetical protein
MGTIEERVTMPKSARSDFYSCRLIYLVVVKKEMALQFIEGR